MTSNSQEKFKKLMLEKMDSLPKHERNIIKHIVEQKPIVRNQTRSMTSN